MENFIKFIIDLILAFWSAFINIDYFPISFPFYLSVAGLVLMFLCWIFTNEKKAVL